MLRLVSLTTRYAVRHESRPLIQLCHQQRHGHGHGARSLNTRRLGNSFQSVRLYSSTSKELKSYAQDAAIFKEPPSPISDKTWAGISNIKTSHFLGSCATFNEYLDASLNAYANSRIGYRKLMSKDDICLAGNKCVRKKLHNEYTYLTYAEVSRKIDLLTKGLHQMGVHPGDRVGIYLETRLEWFLSFCAVNKLGAVAVPLYPTLGEAGLVHCLNQSKCTIIIAGNDRLSFLKSVQSPFLKHLVYVPDVFEDEAGNVTVEEQSVQLDLNTSSFPQLELEGEKVQSFENYSQKPEDIFMINYTSGSSGVPKGVVFDHAGAMSGLTNISAYSYNKEITSNISYLPLAHSFEFSITMMCLDAGISIHFGTPLTLLPNSPGLHPDSLGDISLAKPEMIDMVPVMLDRIKKATSHLMKSNGVDVNEVMATSNPEDPRMQIIAAGITNLLGGNLKFVVTGSAPLSTHTEKFFKLANLPVRVGYGSTETFINGACCETNLDISPKFLGNVGEPSPNTNIKLRDWEEGGYFHSNNEGEILVNTAGLALGYYDLPEESADSFVTHEGKRYWASGDIGRFDAEGRLFIIDRKKELHKLDNGEYISLAKIETELRSNPLIEMICLTTNEENTKLIALVVPNPQAMEQLREHSASSGSRLEQIAMGLITETGRKMGLKDRQIPSHVILATDPWTPENGLLTASFKIRRKNIRDFYKEQVKRLVQSG